MCSYTRDRLFAPNNDWKYHILYLTMYFKLFRNISLVIVLIIAAIALVVVLLTTQNHFNNQSNKVENFNALWNQSLADLRSGNTTVGEYCINSVHDEDFCNRLKSLEYIN